MVTGGYAESHDGIHWERLDDLLSLDISPDESAWDSKAIAYPYVLNIKTSKSCSTTEMVSEKQDLAGQAEICNKNKPKNIGLIFS